MAGLFDVDGMLRQYVTSLWCSKDASDLFVVVRVCIEKHASLMSNSTMMRTNKIMVSPLSNEMLLAITTLLCSSIIIYSYYRIDMAVSAAIGATTAPCKTAYWAK